MPQTLEHIGVNAFGECTQLQKIEIPESVTSIGSNAFENCVNLNSLKIASNKIKLIGKNVFSGCNNITHIDVPDTLLNNLFDFSSMYNLKDIVCNHRNILHLEDNERFNNLINNNKYIYMNYYDKDDKLVHKIVPSKPNIKSFNSTKITEDFIKLYNHKVFNDFHKNNWDDEKVAKICLNMISVLDINTCMDFLDKIDNCNINKQKLDNKKTFKQVYKLKFIMKLKNSSFLVKAVRLYKKFFRRNFNKERTVFKGEITNSKNKVNFSNTNDSALEPFTKLYCIFSKMDPLKRTEQFDKFFSYNSEKIAEIDNIDTLLLLSNIYNNFSKILSNTNLRRKCNNCAVSKDSNQHKTDKALTLEDVIKYNETFGIVSASEAETKKKIYKIPCGNLRFKTKFAKTTKKAPDERTI